MQIDDKTISGFVSTERLPGLKSIQQHPWVHKFTLTSFVLLFLFFQCEMEDTPWVLMQEQTSFDRNSYSKQHG